MSSPSVLVDLGMAKEHLRVYHNEENLAIQDKLDQAEDIVLDYIGLSTPEWDETNVPPRVQAAILYVLGDLWEHRGDDDTQQAFFNRIADGELHPRITALLYRMKDFPIA